MYHLRIPELIIGFRWMKPCNLLPHEKLIPKIIPSFDMTSVVPSIVACSESGLIIDGHHRYEVFKKMQLPTFPVLLVDYKNPNIITHPTDPLDKDFIIQRAQSTQLMEPKRTQHFLIDLDGNMLPIATLSPNCLLGQHE